MDAGAESARAVRLDPDVDGETLCEALYTFADRSAFDAYLARHAPRLREEGLERFPLSLGLSYSRTVGEIVAELAGG